MPIKEIHNAFARTQMFAIDPVEAKEGDDVFHFVAYIPFMVTMQSKFRAYLYNGRRDFSLATSPETTTKCEF